MTTRYYLDHNATTPVRPEVVEAMLPYLTTQWGNASSAHTFGREAHEALDASRAVVAGAIGASPSELVFTGCGTESDNLALFGTLRASHGRRRGLVTTTIEHSAIVNSARRLAQDGFPVGFAQVDRHGVVDLDHLRSLVDDTTALVSVMLANNETGVIQPIVEAARIAHDAGALFHTDAVQAAGKVPIDVTADGIDMASLSAHKLNAQKGLGALYIRSGIILEPLTYGGSHEYGLRPGTENVAGIAGFAAAIDLALREYPGAGHDLEHLRDRLEETLLRLIPGSFSNGAGAPRLPGTTNISFPGVDGEAMLFGLDQAGVAVSTGSACTTGEVEPSHVLTAMGVEPRTAQSSLRFSMGWGTTDAAIDRVIDVLPGIVERLRSISGYQF